MKIPGLKEMGKLVVQAAWDIGTAFAGHELGEDKKGREAVGKELRKVLMPDREDVVKDLRRYARQTRAIRRLLKRANTFHGGIITVNLPDGRRMRRTENWVINRILQVEPKDRQWLLAKWNRLCEESPGAFLAELSLLENDWFIQYPRLFWENLGDGVRRLDEDLEPLAAQLRGWRRNQPWIRRRTDR